MSALLKTTIGEIVAGNGHAAQLFELLGIDYASHGHLTLRDACAVAGLDILHIKRSLDQLPHAPERNWLDQPLGALLTYLTNEQSPHVVNVVRDTAAVLDAHCGPCEEHESDVDGIRAAFGPLGELIGPHISREEHVVFPVIDHYEHCWEKAERPSIRITGGLSQPVSAFVAEHGRLTALLGDIHQIALMLASRERRCTALMRSLHDLNHVVREHIHLQNNVLFPRASAIECVVDGPVPPSHMWLHPHPAQK